MVQIQPADIANVQMVIIMVFIIVTLFFILHIVIGFLLKRTIQTIDSLKNSVQDFKNSMMMIVKDTDHLHNTTKEHSMQLKQHSEKLNNHDIEIKTIQTRLRT